MAGSGNPFSTPVEQECPSCKALIKRYTQAQAAFCGCTNCGNWFSISKLGTLERTKILPKRKPILHDPLKPGIKCKLDNIDYILISKAEKADRAATEYSWREYCLFNPVHGYSWLSEYDGHWMRLKIINNNADNQKTGNKITYDEKDFVLYGKYKSVVLSANGEFPDNIYGTSVGYTEYISPPYMLSFEIGTNYRECFLGEYISQEKIAEAFGISKGDLPEKSGVGAIQPVNTRFSTKGLLRISGLFIGLLFLLMILFSSMAEGNEIVNMDGFVSDSLMGTTFTSKSFTLTGRTTALSFDYTSDVSNNWAEADIMLINDKTQETRGLTIGVEFYSGYDDGGSWSEGGRDASAILSSVEPGTYHLNVKPSRGTTSGSGGNDFHINVAHDVTVVSNFVMLLLILLLFPAINWLRRKRFEKARWSNSDYSPFDTSDDDE